MAQVSGPLVTLLPCVPQRLLLGIQLLFDSELLRFEFLQACGGGLQPADCCGLTQLESNNVLMEFGDKGLFIRLSLK